jgi:antitoxin CptB
MRRRRLRAWRRGTREMDLILGPFADACLEALPWAELDLFDRLLAENDHDLYQWITARLEAGASAQAHGPDDYGALLDRITEHAGSRLGEGRAAR